MRLLILFTLLTSISFGQNIKKYWKNPNEKKSCSDFEELIDLQHYLDNPGFFFKNNEEIFVKDCDDEGSLNILFTRVIGEDNSFRYNRKIYWEDGPSYEEQVDYLTPYGVLSGDYEEDEYMKKQFIQSIEEAFKQIDQGVAIEYIDDYVENLDVRLFVDKSGRGFYWRTPAFKNDLIPFAVWHEGGRLVFEYIPSKEYKKDPTALIKDLRGKATGGVLKFYDEDGYLIQEIIFTGNYALRKCYENEGVIPISCGKEKLDFTYVYNEIMRMLQRSNWKYWQTENPN
tara:strand:- start:150 stop:1004 length:855 start_codon:yes stop_codon:yes gene_type:complete